jgi:two-component system CheB/CheR fusion protein
MSSLEAALDACKRELSAIYTHLPGIVFYISVDPDGEFRFVSMTRAGLEATGLSREQVVGARVRDVIPSPSLELVLEHYREAIRTGQCVRWSETSVYPAGTRHAEVAVTPLVGPGGITTHLIGIVHDVTERKRADEQLKVSNERLAEADRSKDEFLAMLSHELRNPLAAIQLAVEGFLRQGSEPGADLRQVFDLLRRQTAQLVRMVDDLLEVSRVTSGKMTLKKQSTDLASLVKQAVETVRPMVEAKALQLDVLVPPEPIAMEVDPARLVQALINLLANAAKYTKEGGKIALSAQRDGEFIILRVKDSGIGIAPEMIEAIFDLFVQSDHALDRSRGGLGLGLTVVRRIVELHGGTVAASSAGIGKGSEFVTRLPVGHVNGAAPTQPAPTRVTASRGRRVLVVEDNQDLAEGLSNVLARAGHEVRCAGDGPSAITSAEEFRPEIVLLDIGLPIIDGYEVARRLRRLPGFEDVSLVALSGYGERKDRQRAKEAGFDLHLVKPADLDRLESVIADLPRRPER